MSSSTLEATEFVHDHREIAGGLLRALIRQAGLTVDTFRELL